ncbi:MAG: hypothetical protein AAF787_17535 [Chloroflexota bacterium]
MALIRVGYGMAYQPQTQFTHAMCDGPCWRGLDMYSATYDDVAAALNVVDFPVYQRYKHTMDDHDLYLLFRERLIFLEVQGIDCPVGLFTQTGRPYAATLHHTGQRSKVFMYFYAGSRNYTVLWESDSAFTVFQSRTDPIRGTLRSESITWPQALALMLPDCL